MSILVVDTNVVSYVMLELRLAARYRPHLEGHTLTISFMTVGELYEGAYRRRWGKQKMSVLTETLKRYMVIPSSPEVCRLWGWIRAERRKQPIAVDDAWIAATARAHGCPLVTHNPNDFRAIEGLDVITEYRSSSADTGQREGNG